MIRIFLEFESKLIQNTKIPFALIDYMCIYSVVIQSLSGTPIETLNNLDFNWVLPFLG